VRLTRCDVGTSSINAKATTDACISSAEPCSGRDQQHSTFARFLEPLDFRLFQQYRRCPDFNALHSRRQDPEVQLYAFDIMALGGQDLRAPPLSMRKTNLAPPCQAGGRHLCCPVRTRRDWPGPISSGPATWGWGNWCRNGPIGLTAPAGRRIGSR